MKSSENPLTSSNKAPDLFDRDDECYSIEEGDHPVANIGSKIQCFMDGVVKDGKIVIMLLDSSKTLFLCTIKCKVYEVIQTTREYFKLRSEEKVTVTP